MMGVFAILSLLIIAIDGQVMAFQRRTSAEAKVVSDTRYALEAMANALRIGTVYYAGYDNEGTSLFDSAKCGLTSSSWSKLYLIDEDEERVRYDLQSPCVSGETNGCLRKTFYGSRKASVVTPTPVRLTAKDLNIRSFIVSIQPTCNPYNTQCRSGGSANIRQPLVTLSLGVDVPVKGGGTQTRYVQTTVSSRVYKNIPDVCCPINAPASLACPI